MPNPPAPGEPGSRSTFASRIAIAGLGQVYSTGRVETALGELPANANDAAGLPTERSMRRQRIGF